jgi:hypothetical protein
MPDYIASVCPHCQHSLRIRTEYVGRKIICKYCNQSFLAADSGQREASRPETVEEQIRLRPDGEEIAAASATTADQLREAVSEASRLQALVEVLQPQLVARDLEIESLKRQLAEMGAARDQLRSQAEAAQGQITVVERLEAERQEHLQAADQLRARVGELEHSLAAATAATEAAQQNHAAVTERLEGERDAVLEQVEQLRPRLSQLEESLAIAQAGTDTAQREAESSLERERSRAEAERHSLQAEWEERHRDGLQELEQRLRDAHAGIVATWQEKERQWEATRGEQEKEAQGLRAEAQTLKQEQERLAAERDEIAVWHHQLVRQTGEQKDEFAERQRLFGEQLETLKQENEQFRAQAQQHETDRGILQHELEASRAEVIVERQQREAQEKSGQLQIEQQRQTHEATISQLRDAASRQSEEFAARMETAERELQQLRQEIDQLRGELGAAQIQTRSQIDGQRWQSELLAIQEQFERERKALQTEAERYRQQALTLRHALEGMGIHV